MHRVSVVIPTWNRAQTLRAAIDSVLNQSFPVHEVLVCDDGSTDDSQSIVATYPAEKVKWIEGPRAGRPAIPRNRGIRIAEGDWIAFLDSDDEWMPAKIEKQMKDLADSGLKASCTNAYRVVPGKGTTGKYLGNTETSFNLAALLRTNYVICSSALISKSVLVETGGFPEDESLRAIEDFALWLRVATKTSFSYNREPLTVYLDDAANSIRSGTKEGIQRESVMRDLYNWNLQQPQKDKYHDAIRKAYRIAMKNNSRSFFERLKIK